MEALYSVVERDADGDVTARFDYLPEHEAETTADALRRNRKRINTDLHVEIEECRRPDRYTGWTDLTVLVSYGYVPESIVFTDAGDQRLLEIRASGLDAFDAWAERLGVTVSARDVSRPATRHSAAEGLWRGWWITLECVVADFGAPEPARPTQDDPFADYGFNPTTPAYTEVEVYDRSPSLATVHLRRVEGGPDLTAAYAFGGTAPAWLAEVPLGTRLLVLCGTDDVVVSGWVEPAADRPVHADGIGDAPTCDAVGGCAICPPAAPAAPVAVSPERVEDFDALRKHLVSSHVMLSALGFSDEGLVRAHDDEHDGPCTIRNHDRADHSFDDAKIAKLRADEGYPCHGCGWTNQECIDEMNSDLSALPRCCGACGINDSHGVTGVTA